MKWNVVKYILKKYGVKATAVIAGLGVASAIGISYRHNGTFQPGKLSHINIRDNNIIFPEDETRTGSKEGEGEEQDLWEQEQDVDEDRLPKNERTPANLFEHTRLLDDTANAANLIDNPTLPETQLPQERRPNNPQPVNPINVIPPDNNPNPQGGTAIPTINVPANTGDNTGNAGNGNNGNNGGNNRENTNAADSGNAASPSVTPSAAPANTNDNQNVRPTATPASPTPAPQPVVTPAVQPTNPSVDEPTVVDPVDDPEPEDDPSMGEHPSKREFHPYPSFPTNGIVVDEGENAGSGASGTGVTKPSEGGNEKPAQYKAYQKEDIFIDVSTLPRDYEDAFYPKIYKGQRLSAKTVLYTCKISISIDINQDKLLNRDEIFNLDDISNPNVRITGYPKVAEEDFEVKIGVRANVNSQWQEVTAVIPVFDQKLVIKDQEDRELYTTYLHKKDEIQLNTLYVELMGYDLEFDAPLKELFCGLSESKDGPSIGNTYIAREEGEKVLYKRPLMAVPEGMTVMLNSEMQEDSDQLNYIQTLSQADEQEDFVIPEGVERVTAFISAKTLTIPESVTDLSEAELLVGDGFYVDKENLSYTANDEHLLLSHEGDVLYGVPYNAERVNIPSTVTKILCALGSDDATHQQLFFVSRQVPEFDFNHKLMASAVLIVPKEAYPAYLAKWKPEDEEKAAQLISSDDLDTDEFYLDRQGAVLQRLPDGNIRLCRIPDYTAFLYKIPEEVTIIGSGVLDADARPSMIVVPSTVRRIESRAFDKSCISHIRFLASQTAPQMARDAFFGEETVSIEILGEETKVAGFVKEMRAQLDEETGNMLNAVSEKVLETADGACYRYTESDDLKIASLVKASEEWTDFTPECILEDLVLTSIEEEAFANMEQLKIVDLPDSVTEIKARAFENCSNLQGIVSETVTDIFVGEGAFDGCEALRFVAFNSDNVQFERLSDAQIHFYDENEWTYGEYALYLPLSSENKFEVDDDGNQIYSAPGTSYFLVPQGEGYILYGEDANVGNERYVLRATTNISGSIVLEENTVAFMKMAFLDCHNPFSIDEDSQWSLCYILADAFFNATGFTGNTAEEGHLYLSYAIGYIEDLAFYGCTGLTSVDICMYETNLASENDPVVLPDGVFENCTNLSEVTFDSMCNVQQIGMSAFSRTALRSITLPPSVTLIGNKAFGMSLEELNFTGDIAPAVAPEYPGDEFFFKESESYFEDGSNDLTILINGAPPSESPELAEQFVERWKYNFLGFYATYPYTDDAAEMYFTWYVELYDKDIEDELYDRIHAMMDEETVPTEIRAREILGLEMPDDPEEPEEEPEEEPAETNESEEVTDQEENDDESDRWQLDNDNGESDPAWENADVDPSEYAEDEADSPAENDEMTDSDETDEIN